MTAHQILRDATASQHARIDRLFGALDLKKRGDYARFLLAQAGPLLGVEAALDRHHAEATLPDWQQRKRGAALKADLADLGHGAPPALTAPELSNPAAQMGAIYVLEGSRLGGAYLRRQLPDDAPVRFLGAPQAPGAWRRFLGQLDASLAAPEQMANAVSAAVAVFESFEASGKHHLEREGA